MAQEPSTTVVKTPDAHWAYERQVYSIFSKTLPLLAQELWYARGVHAWELWISRTPAHDADVQVIVEALSRIAAREE